MLCILGLACLLPALAAASGCASVGVTLAGLGAGVGMNHYTNNVTSRTFTEPLADVRQAVHEALKRMAIPVEGTAQTGAATMITAKAGTRELEIEPGGQPLPRFRDRRGDHRPDREDPCPAARLGSRAAELSRAHSAFPGR